MQPISNNNNNNDDATMTTTTSHYSSNFDFNAGLTAPSFIPVVSSSILINTNNIRSRSPPIPAVITLADPGAIFTTTNNNNNNNTKGNYSSKSNFLNNHLVVEPGDIENDSFNAHNKTTDYRLFSPLFSLQRYQPYFDVSTIEVYRRLKLSVFPWKSPEGSFWDSVHIHNDDDNNITPNVSDLYAALWVSTTLILILPIASNCAIMLNSVNVIDLLSSSFHHGRSFNNKTIYWNARFDIISLAAGSGLLILFLPSILLWLSFKYAGGSRPFNNFLSLMGYALSPFVIASFLCSIPFVLLQWIFLLTAGGLSARFVVNNLKPDIHICAGDIMNRIEMERKKITAIIMLAVLGLFEILSIIIKSNFF